MTKHAPMPEERRKKALKMADNGTFIQPYLDFMAKLWLRMFSKETLCQLIQLFLPEYKILDITFLDGEMLPHAWKRMLSDGSVVTEIQKTYHLDNLAIMKVKQGSDPEPFSVFLNIEAQSRNSRDLIIRQDLYSASMVSISCKKGDKYTDLIGKIRAISLVLCAQTIQYFADPKVCNNPGRVIHQMGGSHYKGNLDVSTNVYSLMFVDINKLLRKPENDRIVMGSPVLGAFLEVLGSLHKMNGAQLERVMKKGGKPVMELVDNMIDISERQRLQDIRKKLLSKEAIDAARMKDARSDGLAEGMAKGEAKGEAKAQREFAHKLILRGFDYDEIAQLTGLSVGEVKELSLARAANS